MSQIMPALVGLPALRVAAQITRILPTTVLSSSSGFVKISSSPGLKRMGPPRLFFGATSS
jgi:hypothetical protein